MSCRYPGLILGVLALALTACGKKVVNPAKTRLLGPQGAENDGDATAVLPPVGATGTGSDATATAQGPDQAELDDLHDLLAKEREERIAADADLQSQIDALSATLQRVGSDLAVQIAKLDEQSSDTQLVLTGLVNSSAQALAILEAKIQASDADLAQELRDELSVELQKLRDESAAASADQKSKLEALVAELEKKVAKSDGELAADLRAALKVEITKVEQALAALKAEAAATFATKAELQVLEAGVAGLEESLTQVTQKFEDGLRDLHALVRAEHRVDVARLQAQIDALKLDLVDLEDTIDGLEADIDAKLASTRAAIDADISGIRLQITQLQAQDSLQIAAITSLSRQLDEKTEFLFRFFGALALDLSSRIDALRRDMASMSAEQRAEVQAQVARLEEKLDQLAAEERRARAELAEQIRQIVVQIQTMEVFARESRNLILANRDNIERERQEIARLREDMQRELAQLNNEFTARLAEVKQIAVDMTVALGTSIQQQFVTVNATLAALNQRINAQFDLILVVLVDIIGNDAGATKPLLVFLGERIPPLAKDLNQIGFDRVALENEFVNLITPFAPAPGVDPAALDGEFRQLLAANACDGFAGGGGLPSALANKEWFMHVAGEYVALLTAGIRSGSAEYDRIYFGLSGRPGDEESTSGALLAATLASYASGSSCQRAVTAWARSKFLGSDAQAARLRTAIAGSARIGALARELVATITAFRTASASFEADFVAALAASGKDPDLIRTWLFTSTGGIRPIDRIVAYVLDSVDDYRQLAESDANRNRIFELAKTVAAQQEATLQVTRSVSQLAEDFELLEAKVTRLSQSVADVKAQVAMLQQSQLRAFELIAAIAGRLGFQDIVDRADDEITNLGGTPGSRVPEGCYAVQHFYNHATNPSLPVARCESLLTTHDRMLSSSELTRCAIHGGFASGSGLIAYTWGNESQVANGWDARGGTIGGHRVQDGLLIRPYEATDATVKAIAGRARGSGYPSDRESTLVYRVLGNAAKLKFEVTSEANPSKWPYTVTVDAAAFLKGQTDGLSVYEVPLPKAISQLGACTWNRRVKVTALSATDTAGAKTCAHRFHTFSPIVLNLAGAGMITTIPPTESKVWFDLDANGIPERTGWIAGDSALLGRDLDRNGRIDDGRELFGEATIVAGKKAANGYAALAALDVNRDGVVDAKDPAYSELLLWKDLNGDGVSQAYELRPASALGIDSIRTRYVQVDEKRQLQADAKRHEANLVKYESRYSMPGCGAAGCASFDVYFGSSEYTTTAAEGRP
jgi:hypothetical protein